jgi:hypothetical protein
LKTRGYPKARAGLRHFSPTSPVAEPTLYLPVRLSAPTHPRQRIAGGLYSIGDKHG